MICEYAHRFYGVPACIGRRITHYGRPGIIVEDRGHYLGVNFDHHKPGDVRNVHPDDCVEYGEMGRPRPVSRAQKRYLRYLKYGDGFDSFIAYCRWDAAPERNWNGGAA